MTNFGEHYNEELAQQESRWIENPVGDGRSVYCFDGGLGTGVWTFSDSKRNCVQCDVCNFHRFFYCVCDLIF